MKRADELTAGDRIRWGASTVTVEAVTVFKGGLVVMVRTLERCIWATNAEQRYELVA